MKVSHHNYGIKRSLDSLRVCYTLPLPLTRAYLIICFLVAWKPPSALKREGAHQKGGGDALTALTNNPCVSAVLHSDEPLLSSSKLNPTRSQWRQELGLAS